MESFMNSFVGKYILVDDPTFIGNSHEDSESEYIIGLVTAVEGEYLLLSAHKNPNIDPRPAVLFDYTFLLSLPTMSAKPSQFSIFDTLDKLAAFLKATPEMVVEDLPIRPHYAS
jgi:hypothetical protein